MREIKFRGKRVDNGEWVYGYYLKSASTFIAVDDGLVDGHFDLYEVDPATVGQFTGMRDKNGQEIYEGDIIEDGNGKLGVVLSLGGTRNQPNGFGGFEQFGCYTKTKDGLWEQFKNTCFVGMEVIGNIYENPELLEVKKCVR